MNIKKIVGTILVFAVWAVIERNAIPKLSDWSTPEMMGYNLWTLFTLGIAIYIVYRLNRNSTKTSTD